MTCGDGATSEGDFYEAINVAGAWGLPVVFVVNNNQWAISVPLSKQTKSQTIAQKAIAAGFNGVQVDGNDVVALKSVFHEAIDKARNQQVPTLIEALTFRLCDHTTADDAKRYIKKEDHDLAMTKEPLIRLNKFLRENDAWDDDLEANLKEHCDKQIKTAVEEYLNTPAQPFESIFDSLYETLPEAYHNQRDQTVEDLTHE